MAESFYLKLMGEPELRRADGRVIRFKVKKHLALLIYLVMEGKDQHYRDELAELLWPRVPEENSRHSLSMAFSVLRSLFGASCITGNHAIVRFSTPAIALDLDQLERGDILGNGSGEFLKVDGFLREFQIDDAPGFQHWRDRRFAQLLPAVKSGILLLIDLARRSANLTGMLSLADRLVELDPLSEEAIRARMEVSAVQGDRVGALRIFETWKRQLAEELGAAPSELLSGMAERLRRRGMEVAAVLPAPRMVMERRFVGRAAEYQTLFEAWEATLQGNTRHVLITGESGIGKSTLAMRFASAAQLEGAAVARVQCFELEQRIAFGMIGALIANLLDHPAVSGTSPAALAELARVVPKVRDRFPELPAARQSEGEAARLQFAEGTFALLQAIMEEQPVVLIVDDYPRSDEASLSVLHHLLRRSNNDRLMVILGSRPSEPGESEQAGRTRSGFSFIPFERINLQPLSETEGSQLLGSLLEETTRRPSSLDRRAIVRTGGGNPMALELLARDWITHGDVALAILLPAMADAPRALKVVGYDHLIDRLLPSLSPKTRLTLYLSAILGSRLNDTEYFELLDLTSAQTTVALSELIDHRILRNTENGMEFVNELIRARLYLKIPYASRVRLHSLVADRLLRTVEDLDSSGLEIAWHLIRSKQRDRAIPFLLSGSRHAIAQGASHDAARALTTALSEIRGSTRTEATLLLAESYHEMGESEAALECIEKIAHECRSDPRLEGLLETITTDCRRHLGRIPLAESEGIVLKLIGGIRTGPDPSIRVRCGLSATLLAGAYSPHLVSVIQEALEEAPQDQLNALDLAKLMVAKAMNMYFKREGDKGLKALLAADQILGQVRASDTTFVKIHTGLGVIAMLEGRYHQAVGPTERAFQAAQRLENADQMCTTASNLALCYHRLGSTSQQRKWAKIAVELASNSSPGSYDRVFAQGQYALGGMESNNTQDASEGLRGLRAVLEYATVPWVRQAALLSEADILWLLGKHDDALAAVGRAKQIADKSLSRGYEGRFARWNTVYCTRNGSVAEGRDYLEAIHSRIESLDALDRAEVLCSLAWLDRRNRVNEKLVLRARRELSALPPACAHQIGKMGVRIPA